MTLTLNVADTASTIQGATGIFSVSVTGFPNGLSVTGAHVNSGAAGVIGPDVIDFGLGPMAMGFPNGSGSLNRTLQVAPSVASQILANPSGFYFEVDTLDNPSGAVRGQLVNVTSVAK
jgi:hypothetical protein